MTPDYEIKTDGSVVPTHIAPVAMDIGRFLKKDIQPPRRIVTPILNERGLMMIHGPRGAGKTHAGLGLAWAMATATAFLKWEVDEPRRVMLFDC